MPAQTVGIAPRSDGSARKSCHPPPTLHITFLVGSCPLPLALSLVGAISLHVITFLDNGLDTTYCALTSSPSLGVALSRGSTRSIRRA